jgi:hypothetical protein
MSSETAPEAPKVWPGAGAAPRASERELLANMKAALPELLELQRKVNDEWVTEDLLYRFWYQSFKVYYLQEYTVAIRDALNAIAPQGCGLSEWFEQIVREGTGQQFERSANDDWIKSTRHIPEAFFHARHMLEMVIRYATELQSPPSMLPSGWAAVLCLYNLR